MRLITPQSTALFGLALWALPSQIIAEQSRFLFDHQGKTVYTVPFDDFNRVHSFFRHRTLGTARVVGGYHLALETRLQKLSYSNPLTLEDVHLSVWPSVYYSGSARGLLYPDEVAPKERATPTTKIQSSTGHRQWAQRITEPGGEPVFIRAGNLTRFSPGRGLVFRNFIGEGAEVDVRTQLGRFYVGALGAGYINSDDVRIFHYYLPLGAEWEVGAGIYYESDPFVSGTAQAKPSLVLAYNTGWWTLYAEGGPSIPSGGPGGFSTTEKLQALAGTELTLELPQVTGPGRPVLELAAEGRYTGRQITSVYHSAAPAGGSGVFSEVPFLIQPINIYQDLFTLDQYNNQPFHFWAVPDSVVGAYLRQELQMPIWERFGVAVRNEVVLISSERRGLQGSDILSLELFWAAASELEFGVELSNKILAWTEYDRQLIGADENSAQKFTRWPFLLEAGNDYYIDFFLRYGFSH